MEKALSNIHQVVVNNQEISFSNPSYYLENLEAIKYELISKATQDARVRAKNLQKTVM